MTARDAATEADPTAEVAAGHPADAGSPTADAAVVDAPADDAAAIDDGTAAGGTADGGTADDGTTDEDPEGDAAVEDDPAAARGKRRGRRHRHAPGDDGDDGDAATPAATRRAPRRRTRWIVATLLVVSVLFAGAMVTLYVVQRPAPIAGLSGTQQSAVDAATQAAINLQTFRRASFDQDFANALASLTPDFAKEQLEPRKDALKQQLTQGGRDASATALSAGLVSSTSTQAVVLVVTNTTQTADDGTSTPFVFSRLQLTLQRVDGRWLVSDLKSVGLS